MSAVISEHVRTILSQSLPLVDARRDELVEQMETALRAAENEDEAFGQSEVTAMMLVELLLDHARTLVETGAFGRLEDVEPAHRSLDIDGRHYSRFGDALVAILRDVLGAKVPREVPAAWCDAFWAMIRAARAEQPIAA